MHGSVDLFERALRGEPDLERGIAQRCAQRGNGVGIAARADDARRARARLRARSGLHHRDERGPDSGARIAASSTTRPGASVAGVAAEQASCVTRATSGAPNGSASVSAIRSSSASWRTRALAEPRLLSAKVLS